MTQSEIRNAAAALYDGGWRAGDTDQMMAEYDMSRYEAEQIAEYLKRYEQ